MIELRWLKRSRPPGLVCRDDGLVWFLALQYRVRENVNEIGLQPAIWSEWQDVPMEAE